MLPMPRLLSPRSTIAIGLVLVVAAFLSPALLPEAGSEALLPAVLPVSFLAAGGVAEALRAGHPIGARLAWVGVLHLLGLVGGVLAHRASGVPAVATGIGAISVLAFALGFVALLDLLVRYPDGRYAWRWTAILVRATLAAALVLTVLAVLGSRVTPEVIGLASSARNPWFVPEIEAAAEVGGVIALAPVVGLALVMARYPGAPEVDRQQMRWPIVTAWVLTLGILTTGLLETTVGAPIQSALFVVAGAALPASFLVGLLRHSAEAERLAAMETSRARIAEASEAERRRIERDLHDGAQQQLIALLSRVELWRSELSASDAPVRAELDAIANGIQGVHRDLRELARGIHPAILTDCGLAEAVTSAAARLPMRIGVKVAPDVAKLRYPAAVEGAAYLFVLEALTNVSKHAGTDAAQVRLEAISGALVVTVHDSGHGFDPGAAKGGSGLTNMRDRLTAVGGTLVVEARPGGGTSLRGIFPTVVAHGR